MKNEYKSIILYAVASVLLLCLTPIGILYTALKQIFRFKFITWFKILIDYFVVIIVAIDQLMNVLFQDLFNDLLLKRSSKTYEFGDPDDTIGFAIRKNNQKHSLTLIGKIFKVIIDHKK